MSTKDISSDFTAKTKITEYTAAYKRVYVEEYDAFLRGQKIKHDNLSNKFAEVKNQGVDNIYRGLVEVPETLHVILYNKLTPIEYAWYHSLEGKVWFGREYPEFRMGKVI